MIMQKRANNFYNKNDKNNTNLRQNTEENYFGDKYSQINLTEKKNFNKDNINSPHINAKKNFLINTDLRHQNKQYIYESGEKSSNNAYFFKNNQSNKKIIPNNLINQRKVSDMNKKYYTDYNNENDELEYYQEIQSKIYKKVIEQIYNNLYKYCKKYILDSRAQFIKNLKEIAIKNPPKQKTYRKKNIVNKNVYKLKKTPDKYSLNNNYMEKFTTSPSNNKFNKKGKNNFISQNTSVNNSNNKNNVIYSNYYNLNIFETNTNNKYIYSNKKNQTKFLKDYNNYTLPDKNINNLNASNDFHKSIGARNNILYSYANRKNIIKTSIRKNSNISNYTQPRNYPNLNQETKPNLKIDHKNSMEFVTNATKKKIIDKLQNIKLFKQTNDNKLIDTKVYTKEDLEKKKTHFHNLMTKLKNISFYKRIEKFVMKLINNTKIDFFELLKLNSKKEIHSNPVSQSESILKSENKEQENIKFENDNNINNENYKENENENNININKEDNPNKEEIIEDNKKEDNFDEIKDMKDVEINYESIKEKIKEETNNNDIQNNESKNQENSENKIDENEEEKNTNNENNLEIKSNENSNNEENIINEEKNIDENINGKNNDNININSECKEEIIEKKELNDKEQDILNESEINLENQINNKTNEGENNILNNENTDKNVQSDNEIIKDNDNEINEEEQIKLDETKRNDFLQKIFNNILLKEKINTLKNYFNKWSQEISDINTKEENNINENQENNINEYEEDKEEIILENEIGNKNDKRDLIKIKTLFLDEVDDEEKSVIMEEMVFRFRTLLMLSCFKTEEYSSD